MESYSIIDADGHVRESLSGMREFLEPRWQRRNLFPMTPGIAIYAGSSVPSPKERAIRSPR
jgi:hypothetical protein